jgi:hypothetical protein
VPSRDCFGRQGCENGNHKLSNEFIVLRILLPEADKLITSMPESVNLIDRHGLAAYTALTVFF